MILTEGNRLELVMLALLCKQQGVKSEDLDPDLVIDAITSQNSWALDGAYRWVRGLEEPIPATVHFVDEVMDMWAVLETAFAKLSPAAQAEVKEATGLKSMTFDGFEPATETDETRVMLFLIDKMGRYGQFKGRSLSAPDARVSRYGTMLVSYKRFLAEAEGKPVFGVDDFVAMVPQFA